MNESALRASLAILEMRRASIVPLLELSTWLVVVGLFVDGGVIINEYWERVVEFRRGTIHTPEKPPLNFLFWGLLGTFLVAGGVAGELFFQAKIGTIETEMRLTSDSIVSLVSREAGSAGTSADKAAKAADRANTSALNANAVAGTAKATAAGAKSLAQGARQEADSFEADIVAAKKTATEAESKLAELRKETAPRHVTAQQRKKFLAAWKTPLGHMLTALVVADLDVPDSKDFGEDLLDLLQDAGFSKAELSPNAIVPEQRAEEHGIAMSSGTNRYDDAEAIAAALAASDIASSPIPCLRSDDPSILVIRATKIPRRQAVNADSKP